MAANSALAGWYPERENPAVLRWWDGSGWTLHTAPVQQVAMAPTPVQAQPSLEGGPGPAGPASKHSARHAGSHGRKRDLQAEVDRLQRTLDDLGIRERDELQAEVSRLRQEVPALRQEQMMLSTALGPLRAEASALNAEQAVASSLRAAIQQMRQQKDALTAEIASSEGLRIEVPKLKAEYAELSGQLVETREVVVLQEAGIYQYRHPLEDGIAYKARLARVQARIKDAVKAGRAVQGATNWTGNGSAREGAKMVREFSKLMLRAYNNEADNAVRAMKPYALDSSVARLRKARETISKLGGTMNIRITDHYHRMRVDELELTADYLAKVAEKKERAREERVQLREEALARREFEREQERLRKEQAHYETAGLALRNRGDLDGAAQADAKLDEIRDALDGINRRAANIRAGHVYVISNVGSFGHEMVKIGMTRRLEPLDRVRELVLQPQPVIGEPSLVVESACAGLVAAAPV